MERGALGKIGILVSISFWAIGLFIPKIVCGQSENTPVTKINQWQALNSEGQKGQIESGNPSEAKISVEPSPTARWILGKDGSFAVVAATQPSGGWYTFSPAGEIRLQDGQEAVFSLKRYETSGENGWKSLAIGVANDLGHSVYFNLNPAKGFFSKETLVWEYLQPQFEYTFPALFRIQRREGKLHFYSSSDSLPLFEIADPSNGPYNRIQIKVAIEKPKDALLAEFGPVEIRKIPPPPPPPSLPLLPTAEQFPRIILAHVMTWSTPYWYGQSGEEGPDKNRIFYENAPLITYSEVEEKTLPRPHLPWREEANPQYVPRQYFLDAAAAGIDAFSINCFTQFCPPLLLDWAESAKNSGTGTKITPVVILGLSQFESSDILQRLWGYEKLRNHPNFLKIGECPVLLTYSYIGDNIANIWKEKMADVAKLGGRFFIITNAGGSEIYLTSHVQTELYRDAVEVVNGLYYFASWTLAITDNKVGPLPEFMEFGRSFSPKKVVGASVTPGYIGAHVGGFVDSRGTYLFRRQWVEIIKYNPDFVHLTTWNDYTETEMECSSNSTFAFIDLNAYFGSRWKTGKWPKLSHPQAFLSYRKAIAVSEPVEMELVLLQPEITGEESETEIAKRFKAEIKIQLSSGRTISLNPVTPEVLPGHLCWRFWGSSGLGEAGYAIPSVNISVDGKILNFPEGPLAPFTVVLNEERVARKWRHVQLHRIKPGVQAKIVVKGSPGNLYPRTVMIEGLPWEEVAGGVIEKGINPLSITLSARQLREGFLEDFQDFQQTIGPSNLNPGGGKLTTKDAWGKRHTMDQSDRYTAVIRLKDNTFVYPTPALVESPRADSGAVTDFCISPNTGNTLVDRSGYRRDLELPKQDSPTRPAILQDAPGKPWYLRFDGVDDKLDLGTDYIPSGPATLEVWLRPSSIGKPQPILEGFLWFLDSTLSLGIGPEGNLYLTRWDMRNWKDVVVKGKEKLEAGKWHHLVAVFTGTELALYVNGREDGARASVVGVYLNGQNNCMGCGTNILRVTEGRSVYNQTDHPFYLQADIARFRVLQGSLSGTEINNNYQTTVKDFL